MERYELVEGTTAKFWQWEVRGSDLVVQYGRIGSAGKEQVKSFPDEDEARKAAAKLMREKTGKGYGLVGATVEKASINKDPVDAELVALAKKVAAKREYASNSIKYLKSQVTARRAMPLLWTMAANGLLPAKALTAQLPTLAEDVEWASPSELVAVLERVPKTFEANRNVLWLLDNYPEFVDTLLMHAAWRAPKELAAAKLGPNVARALPFVRRRLGLETEAPDSAQLVELVRHHMDCRARSASAWFLVDKALVRLRLHDRLDRVAELASHLAPREDFEPMLIAEASRAGSHQHGRGWRIEPYFLQASLEDLPELLEASNDVYGFQCRVLAARQDSSTDLLAMLAKINAKVALDGYVKGRIAARLALMAGAALVREGQPVPKKLDAYLQLDAGPDVPEPEGKLYAEALRAFGRERVLALVDAAMAEKKPKARIVAAVGLGAFYDKARFAELCGDPEIQHYYGASLEPVGVAGIPTILEAFHAITGSDEDFSTRKQREGLRAGITYIALGAESIDPAWDPLLIPISNYGLVLKRLPQDRRDAVILATLKDEMPRKLDLLALASDSALDQGVEMLVARRKRFTNDQDGDDIESGFTAMGSRGSAALVRHLAGKNDAGAHLIINYSRLDDATVSDLTGGAPPLPVVDGDIKKGARYLATVWPHLATSDATGTLAIASGRLSVGSPDALDIGSVELDREVPKGNHPVTVYWSDADLDALPTAGVEAVMLRFAQSAPASWEEAKTTKGKKAIHVSNLITFCWLDASAKLDELANDAQKTFEDATTDGVVLTDDNQVAAVYVGEIATMHKMFWGLGEDGAPVCLVAGFRYPSED
ncbi:WGR domain-containing protein [Microvenator marinus]|uniref:WGR domain-containing protein n=1 Tax=Microvenator marinus TaxID=2600177 RepID=A0A5B8XRF2_9DELT|nr:WGR domain-containing protein [Microvenator marinus]QED28114.1 WGR domain-containing protein [Microvenator marinus]